jgi:hypothetical protein
MTDVTSLANNLERVISRVIDARMVSERASQRAFFGVSALLFAASAAVTTAYSSGFSTLAYPASEIGVTDFMFRADSTWRILRRPAIR